MKKSIFGLSENIAALLSYALACLSGIVVLVMERDNKFVRFHALQSTIWFLFLTIVGWLLNILSRIWLVGWVFGIAGSLFGIVTFVSWLLLMYKAYRGDTFKLPIVGEVVWTQINK